MKVLFAIGNPQKSKTTSEKYYEKYGEVLEYKDVFFFKALIDEVKQNKSYDRIVIHEDLEQFRAKDIEQLDRKLYSYIDTVTDEVQDSEIIYICSDRRTKDDNFVIRLYNLGIYNILIGEDRNINPLCEIIKKPKSKRDAKEYLKINSGAINETGIMRDDEVDEGQMMNILNHYDKIKNQPDQYIPSFDHIASQYSRAQLKVIASWLPKDVQEAVYAEPKYKFLLGINEQQEQAKNQGNNIPDVKKTERRHSQDFFGVFKKIKRNKNGKIEGVNDIPSASENSKVSNQVKIENEQKEDQENIEKAKREEEERRQQELAERARREAEERQQQELAERARREAEERQQQELAERARREAEERQQQELAERARREAEERQQQELAERARREAEERQKRELEEQAKREAEIKKSQELMAEAEKNVINSDNDDIVDFIIDNEVFNKKEEETIEIDNVLGQNIENQPKIEPEIKVSQEDLIDQARREAEVKAQQELAEKARKEAEDREKQEAAKREAELKTQQELAERARKEAEERQKRELIEIARRDQQEKLENERSQTVQTQYEPNRVINANVVPSEISIEEKRVKEEQERLAFEQEKIRKAQAELEEEKRKFREEQARVANERNQIGNVQNDSKVTTYETVQVVAHDYKKMVVFVGANKAGTSFMVNAIANHMSSQKILTSIVDMTKDKGMYYMYNQSDKALRRIAGECMQRLSNGEDIFMPVSKFLKVYTTIPGGLADARRSYKHKSIIEVTKNNSNITIVDADFTTPIDYFEQASEIYVVQDMDLLKMQETTAFLREMKNRNMDMKKVKVIINKYVKSLLTPKKIIEGISYYKDPEMTFTDVLLSNKVMYSVVPYNLSNYTKYIEALCKESINFKGFTTDFLQVIDEISEQIYPRNGLAKKKGGLFK